jgi:hypothetical protein
MRIGSTCRLLTLAVLALFADLFILAHPAEAMDQTAGATNTWDSRLLNAETNRLLHATKGKGSFSMQTGTTVTLTHLGGTVRRNLVSWSEPLVVKLSFTQVSHPVMTYWFEVGLCSPDPHASDSATRTTQLPSGQSIQTFETAEYGRLSGRSPHLSLHAGIQLNSSTLAERRGLAAKASIGLGVEVGGRASEYTFTWQTPDGSKEVNHNRIRIRDFAYHFQGAVGVEFYPWKRRSGSSSQIHGLSCEIVFELPLGYYVAQDYNKIAMYPIRIGFQMGLVTVM